MTFYSLRNNVPFRGRIKWIYATMVLLLFSSCATILNNRIQTISFASADSVQILSVKGALLSETVSNQGTHEINYYVLRSSSPLMVYLMTPWGEDSITLKARRSFAYWFNIYANYGVGMLMDYQNPKSYGYPNRNYLYCRDSAIQRQRFAPRPVGSNKIVVGIPLENLFHIPKDTGNQFSYGILGIQLGFAHTYSGNRYFSVNVGSAMNGSIMEHFGPYTRINTSSTYINIQNNHNLGIFTLGYGLHATHLNWDKSFSRDSSGRHAWKNTNTLGLNLWTGIHLGSRCQFGVLYQPGIVNLNRAAKVEYSDLISFQFLWDINIPERVPSPNKIW